MVRPRITPFVHSPTIHAAVTVFTGKAELGQGIRTALIQIAAEELEVLPQTIQLVTADTGRTPNEGYTAGSHSLQDSGSAIRHAAAQARGWPLAGVNAPSDSDSGTVMNPLLTIGFSTPCTRSPHQGTSME